MHGDLLCEGSRKRSPWCKVGEALFGNRPEPNYPSQLSLISGVPPVVTERRFLGGDSCVVANGLAEKFTSCDNVKSRGCAHMRQVRDEGSSRPCRFP